MSNTTRICDLTCVAIQSDRKKTCISTTTVRKYCNCRHRQRLSSMARAFVHEGSLGFISLEASANPMRKFATVSAFDKLGFQIPWGFCKANVKMVHTSHATESDMLQNPGHTYGRLNPDWGTMGKVMTKRQSFDFPQMLVSCQLYSIFWFCQGLCVSQYIFSKAACNASNIIVVLSGWQRTYTSSR